MASDPTWAEASPEELEDSRLQMEKRFLTHIYNFVFFPHELSHMNDQLFQAHIRDDLSHLSADHECLQIQEHCRAEMPWPTAQKALLRMNSYKTPSDKLKSIVEVRSAAVPLLIDVSMFIGRIGSREVCRCLEADTLVDVSPPLRPAAP